MKARLSLAATLICTVGYGALLSRQPTGQQAEKANVLPTNHRWAECKLVNGWWEDGTAAGNVGDWYDNRDGGHSPLRIADYFPQLAKVSYTQEELARRADWGLQRRLLPFVAIGNSSTSARPEMGGSLARHYYVSENGISFLHSQYLANNLYVYPEHRDYDPGHNQRPGFGDLYPTNTPYLIISQGSSGSDQAFLRALAHTMAAFRPEVKRKLIDEKLLMPTLQHIMRSCYRDVEKPEDYLTGRAHPTVFSGAKLSPVKMVNAAHEMSIDTVPPMIQLKVVQEDFVAAGRGQPSEKLADTPAVIARIHREPTYRKRIVVSAKTSFDLGNKALKYHWVVLRGDDQRIKIKLREDGAVAELTIPYHHRRPIAPGSEMESTRVDIGAFVHNGLAHSAPGFVTIFYLDTEARTYDEEGRLLDIYRAAGETQIGYPTTYATQLVGSKYDIFDWSMLFATLEKNAKGFASELLKRQFIPEELAVVARAVELFKAEDLAKLQAKGKLSREQLTEQRRIRERLAKALTAEDPHLKASAKLIMERALNAIRGNPNLYFQNAKDIDALVADCPDEKGKAAFLTAKKKLAAIGIFRRGKLQSAVPGAKSLTKYEVYQVELFNLTIMNRLLFPDFLRRTMVKNFVDQRLAGPLPWHDVYRCDSTGKILGWTRYDDGGPSQYLLKERR